MERLLLIEDDDATREVLSLLLQADGWDVAEAADGEAALQACADAPPRVVLSDLNLPGLSGTDLAHALRRQFGEGPRLIAMSATDLPAAPAGFEALLLKPFAAAAVRSLTRGLAAPATAPPAEPAETIATQTFDRLKASMAAVQLRSLYDFALQDAEARVQAMELATEDDAFRRQAHALKGSCAMIGALRVRGLAARAEAVGMQEPAEVQERISELRLELQAVRSMLEGLFANGVL